MKTREHWTMHAQKGSLEKLQRVGSMRAGRWWMGMAALGVVLGLLGWFRFFGDKTLRYSEQVQLASGAVVEVERVVKATPLGEIGGPGGWEARFNSLRMTAGAQVPPPTWENSEGLVPLLFDRESAGGDWVLVATFYTCEAWYAIGRPKLPYAEFRVVNGKWQSVPLGRELVGRDANVLTEIPFDQNNRTITIPQKRGRNADPAIPPDYLRIVDRWTTAC